MDLGITSRRIVVALVGAVFISPPYLNAQQPAPQNLPIERVKMSDGEASCLQLHTEAGEMDKVMAEAKAAQEKSGTAATAAGAAGVATEVVGRTGGFFGAFGSVVGGVLGQAAAQGAAGAAQQTAQRSAAQSAGRAKQAAARKEHVTSLFLNRGCKTSDLNYNPPAPPPGPASTAPAGTAVASIGSPAPAPAAAAPAAIAMDAVPRALPDVDPDVHFRGKMGGTFGKNIPEVLHLNKRVIVAGFRVGFVVHNTVSAQVRASYMPGRDTSGARSTLNLQLNGVDAATMQALTDKAYADLLAQLKLAGREVVPQEELKELFGQLKETPRGLVAETNGSKIQFYSPTSLPMWFTGMDSRWSDTGAFEQANASRVAEASHKLNAIAIAPILVVNFANMLTSGNRSGLVARAAETGAELSMRVTAFSSRYMRSEETRSGIIMKGDDGNIDLEAPIVSTAAFGSIKEASSSDNAAAVGVANALGRLAGLANAGGANRSTSNSVAETTNATYAAAAADVLTRATGTFARYFQKYPVK